MRLPAGVGLIFLVMALAGGYGLYWILVADMVQKGVDDWAADQTAQGTPVSFRSARVSGFPGTVTATLTSVSAQASLENGGWTWSTDALAVEVNPLTPFALTIDLDRAPHTIRVPTGTTAVTLTAATEVGRLRLETTGRRVASAELTVANAFLRGNDMGGDGYTLESLTAHYESSGRAQPGRDDTTHSLSATVTNLTVPTRAHLPLGQDLASAQLTARVLGALDLDQPLDTALKTWRESEGSMMVDTLRIEWPPLTMDAVGRVVLDEGLQPDALLKARMEGILAAVETLQAERLIRGANASMAKVVLASLSQPGEDGQPVLEAAVVVRDGMLWIGPMPLLPLPRMPWGPPAGSLGAVGVRPGFSIDQEGNVVPK